jgi:hypothetical protein
MGAKCSTENICTMDMYNAIEGECEGELLDEDFDKVGGLDFINDYGLSDIDKDYKYTDIYNYDDGKKLICTLVDHGGERCPNGKITFESVCEKPKKIPKKKEEAEEEEGTDGFINLNQSKSILDLSLLLPLILFILIILCHKK